MSLQKTLRRMDVLGLQDYKQAFIDADMTDARIQTYITAKILHVVVKEFIPNPANRFDLVADLNNYNFNEEQMDVEENNVTPANPLQAPTAPTVLTPATIPSNPTPGTSVSSQQAGSTPPLPPTLNQQTPRAPVPQRPSRTRRARLPFGEAPDVWELERRLQWYDSNHHGKTWGRTILAKSEAGQMLPPPWRKKLVKIACEGLQDFCAKVNNDDPKPTVPQRKRLADVIVATLYHFLDEDAKKSVWLSYFTPAFRYELTDKRDPTKKRKLTHKAKGYINIWFYNFLSSNRDEEPNVEAVNDIPEQDESEYTEEEMLAAQEWMRAKKTPEGIVLQKLIISRKLRKEQILSSPFESILIHWPRLFDTDGALFNEYDVEHPDVCDALVVRWNMTAPKLFQYALDNGRGPAKLDIDVVQAEEKKELASFFLVPFVFGAKSRRSATQLDSVKAFITVHGSLEDSDLRRLEATKKTLFPEIHAIGSRNDLEFHDFFVLLKGKAIPCANLLTCVDLAYKAFYVFKINFPDACGGAWQFFDYHFFKMKPSGVLMSKVSEVSAFLSR